MLLLNFTENCSTALIISKTLVESYPSSKLRGVFAGWGGGHHGGVEAGSHGRNRKLHGTGSGNHGEAVDDAAVLQEPEPAQNGQGMYWFSYGTSSVEFLQGSAYNNFGYYEQPDTMGKFLSRKWGLLTDIYVRKVRLQWVLLIASAFLWIKQEGIPVRCVLPASVVISEGGYPGGCLPRGVYTPGTQRQTPPAHCMLGYTSRVWTEFLT